MMLSLTKKTPIVGYDKISSLMSTKCFEAAQTINNILNKKFITDNLSMDLSMDFNY